MPRKPVKSPKVDRKHDTPEGIKAAQKAVAKMKKGEIVRLEAMDELAALWKLSADNKPGGIGTFTYAEMRGVSEATAVRETRAIRAGKDPFAKLRKAVGGGG